MKNELLTIGPLTVYGYGAMIAVGILAAWFLADQRAEKHGNSRDHVFFLLIWCILGGMLGAKMLFWITEWKSLVQDPGFILDTISDGFVVYGGILGGILAGYIYCKIQKIKFLSYFDLLMPSVALAQGFGRIGCFLAGCCYGRETDSIFSVNVCPITTSSVNSFFYTILIQILCICQVIHTFYLKPHIIKRRCFRYDGYMFYCIVYRVLYYGNLLLCKRNYIGTFEKPN